jgi:hypothetical protein
MTAEPTARLTITRHHPQDVQDRPVYLSIDGERIGNLKFGGVMTRELAPRRHTVTAHNTLFSHSLEVNAAPADDIRLTCQNGLTGGGMLMVLMLGVAYLRVKLEREQ